MQHSQVRSNPVVARTISQSSMATPIKTTPAITVKMQTSTPVTPPAGTVMKNVTTPTAVTPIGVGGLTIKKQKLDIASTHTAQVPAPVTLGTAVPKVNIIVSALCR